MENSGKYITGNVGDEMKKVMILFFIMILCFSTVMPMICYAVDTGLGNLDDYGGDAGASSRKLEEKAETILGVIQVVGVIVSVVMLIAIGLKYMLGSIEERAEYKETLKPYLIGAFILFSGTTVPQLIYQIAKNL